MSKIKIEDIRAELISQGWELISQSYTNLDTEMQFRCAEGHNVYSTWKKMRSELKCPICEQNVYNIKDTKIISKPKGAKRVLAFDQASRLSGWAIFDDKQLVKYGKIEFQGEEIERYHQIKEWFISMIKMWDCDFVAIEGIQYQENHGGTKMGVTVFQTLARLQGILLETAYNLGVESFVCPTNTWRAHCGVKGKSRTDKKKSMQLLVKQWYDVSLSNDEADAVGIGKYVADVLVKQSAPKVEMFDWN